MSNNSKNYKILDRVRIYGRVLGRVKIGEVEKLKPDYSLGFHLFRHYKKLPKSYTDKFVGKIFRYFDSKTGKIRRSRITRDKIKQSFETKGSKFFDNIDYLKSPDKLIDFIRSKVLEKIKKDKFEWFDCGSLKRFVVIIHCPDKIGWLNLIKLSDLSKKQRLRLKRIKRGEVEGDEFEINYVEEVKMVTTNKLAVEIFYDKKNNMPISIGVDPGELSADFPNSIQGLAQLKYNKKFWAERIFIAC